MLWDKIARDNQFATERDMFTRWYLDDGLSISQIAHRLNVGTCTVSSRLDRLDIPRRGKGGDNTKMEQAFKLFHLDQRVVFSNPAVRFFKVVKTSYSYLYKYQRRRAPNGVLHYHTNNWSAAVCDQKPQTLTAAADTTAGV